MLSLQLLSLVPGQGREITQGVQMAGGKKKKEWTPKTTVISLLDRYLEKLKTSKRYLHPMFTAALFTITKTRKKLDVSIHR